MCEAKDGDTVKVHYTGKLENDEVFDSSANRAPLEFKIGSRGVIPGFDSAVVGMKVGDRKTVRIEPADAYGVKHKHLVTKVDKSEFPSDLTPRVGQRLQVTDPYGRPVAATVTAIKGDKVTLDSNHPLAGKTLIFDIELLEIS